MALSPPDAHHEPASHDTLPRVLGPFDAITVVVGSIIGSGVFLKATRVAELLQDYGTGPILLVWFVIGLVTLCGSLTLGELAAMMPHAGGPYVYLREAYGRLWGFLWGWTEFWIIRTGSLGALASGSVIAGNEFLKALVRQDLLPAGLDQWVPLSHSAQGALAVVLVLSVSWVNVIGTRWAAGVQNVTTVIKVGFLLFLIGGPLFLGAADSNNMTPVWSGSWWTLAFCRALGAAMVAVMWPYDGWINIGPIAEEIQQPQKNIPLALALGITIIIVLYMGANASYHLVLPMQEVAATSDSLGSSSTVATSVTQRLLGETGVWLASLAMMISMVGALNSNLLTGPRIYFAMARDNLIPQAIRRVHPRFQTPTNSVLLQAGWSLVVVVIIYAVNDKPYAAFNALTDFVIFGGSIFYALAVGAVFVLRWRQPDLERPYRTWGYPLTPAIYLVAFVAAMLSLLIETPYQSLAGFGLILAGAVYYFIWTRRAGFSSPANP